MLETGSRLSARKAFERALEHDRSQPAALLGGAGIDEMYGQYPAVVESLERLVRLLPEHGEGRLRLAVNLRRLGKVEEAEEQLRRGLEEDASDWIAILSYQELAELEYSEGRGEEAVELLRQARERFPDNQRLHVQLAALLDRLGRPAEAREALDQLDPQKGQDQDTPRMRYGQPSRWLALETRRTLEERGTAQRTRLLGALERILGKEDHGSSP
jgi:tetratricopeptide (TPR) repeat protein